MIEWYCLFIPAITAFLNRFARGEGKWERWQWYGFNALLACFVTVDLTFTFFWLIFSCIYAMPPNNALFSVFSGRKPLREDHWLFQWMQRLTKRLTDKIHEQEVDEYWINFGKIYGAIQGALILPSIFLLCGYTQSFAPLVGLLFLGKGILYYWCGRIADHWDAPQISVAIAEVIVGWFIGTLLLICAL